MDECHPAILILTRNYFTIKFTCPIRMGETNLRKGPSNRCFIIQFPAKQWAPKVLMTNICRAATWRANYLIYKRYTR